MIRLPRPRFGALLERLPKLGRTQWMVVAFIAILVATLLLMTFGDKELAFTFFCVAIAVLVLWLVIDRIALAVIRRRERNFDEEMEQHSKTDALLGDWKRAVAELKSTGVDRYSLSFYLLIGEPAGGKTTTLMKSGLNFPIGTNQIRGIGGTANCNWWFTDEAVILDTAGRYVFHHAEGDLPTDARKNPEEWLTFLKLVKRYRPRCPINGVILALPCDSLLTDTASEAERKANIIRSALVEIERTLEIRFPVYTLLTKADRIGGFVDFFSNLKATEQGQLLGWSRAPAKRNDAFEPDEIDQAFRDIGTHLRAWRIKALNDLAERGLLPAIDRMFSFPDELARLASPLKIYLATLFPGGKLVDPLYLRGFYLTSGEQTGRPLHKTIEDALEGRSHGIVDTEDHEPEEKRVFFIRDFYRRKVLQEPELIQPTRAFVRRVRWVRTVGISIAGLLGIIGIALLIHSYVRVQQNIAGPSNLVAEAVHHVYTDAAGTVQEIAQAGRMTPFPTEAYTAPEKILRTLDLLSRFHRRDAGSDGDARAASEWDGNPASIDLIPRLERSELLAPVWIFSAVSTDKGTLQASLWHAYHALLLKGVAEPLWNEILHALSTTRPEDIASPAEFRAYLDAVLAFARLTGRLPDADSAEEALGKLEIDAKESRRILAHLSALPVQPLFDWAKKRGEPFFKESSNADKVGGAFRALLENEAALAEMRNSEDGSVLGALAKQNTNPTTKALQLSLDLIAQRWEDAFHPLDENAWIGPAGERSEALKKASRWWIAYGISFQIRHSVPWLRDAMKNLADVGSGSIHLSEYRERYAMPWMKTYDGTERALAALDAFLKEGQSAHGPWGESDHAKQSLKEAWLHEFFGPLLVTQSNASTDAVRFHAEKAYGKTKEAFAQAANDFDSWAGGEGELSSILKVSDDGTRVSSGGSPWLRSARNELPAISHLMRIAVSPALDIPRTLEGVRPGPELGRVLFNENGVACPDRGLLDEALKRMDLPVVGSEDQDVVSRAGAIALDAANESLLDFCCRQDTWEEMNADLDLRWSGDLDFPRTEGRAIEGRRKLAGHSRASSVQRVLGEFALPLARYARVHPNRFLDRNSVYYNDILDGRLDNYLEAWRKTWHDLTGEIAKLYPLEKADQAGLGAASGSSPQRRFQSRLDLVENHRRELLEMERVLEGWRRFETTEGRDVTKPGDLESAGLVRSGGRWAQLLGSVMAVDQELRDDATNRSAETLLAEALTNFSTVLTRSLTDSRTFELDLRIAKFRRNTNQQLEALPRFIGRLTRKDEGDGMSCLDLVPVHKLVEKLINDCGESWSGPTRDQMEDDYSEWLQKHLQNVHGFPFFDDDNHTQHLNDKIVTAVFAPDRGIAHLWDAYDDILEPRYRSVKGLQFLPERRWPDQSESWPVIDFEPDEEVMRFLILAQDIAGMAVESKRSDRCTPLLLKGQMRRVNRDSADTKAEFSETLDAIVTYLGIELGSQRLRLKNPQAFGQDGSDLPFEVASDANVVVGAFSRDFRDAIGDTCLVRRDAGRSQSAGAPTVTFADGPFDFLEFLLAYADLQSVTYQMQDGSDRYNSTFDLRLPFRDSKTGREGDVVVRVTLDGHLFPNKLMSSAPLWEH